MRRSIIFILKGVFILIFGLVIAEVAVRTPDLIYSPGEITAQSYYMLLAQRINPLWSTDKKEDPLLPPLDVFANQDIANPQRLKKIRDETRALKNKEFYSYDFLRNVNLKEQTRFKVCLNNFGFRNCQGFKKEKAKNSKRVIVYGSYPAFGFGIDESLTYARRIEILLNDQNKKIKFEVWNSGRYAGTGIIGLAHFTKDIEEFKPDFVIYDYGFVDYSIAADNVFPYVSLFKDHNKEFQTAFRLVNFLISRSLVAFRLWCKWTIDYQKTSSQYADVTSEFLKTAKQNKIPVLLVRQLVTTWMPAVFYEKMQKQFPEAMFIDGQNVVQESYNLVKNDSLTDTDKTFWLNDLTPEERLAIKNRGDFLFPEFRLNVWQINSLGHKLMAEAIFQKVKNIPELN